MNPRYFLGIAAISFSVLLGAKGCDDGVWAETNQDFYEAGDTGTAALHNDSGETIYLPGCGFFSYEKQDNGTWIDKGPSEVCVWEGNVSPMPANGMGTRLFRITEPGQWRLRFTVGFGCDEGVPMSQANCDTVESVYTPAFEVTAEDLQACGSRGLEPCGDEMYCDWSPASDDMACGADDRPGVCRPIPHECTDEAEPVCGCDGRDFTNPCRAAQHGIDVAYAGACSL
jgi:hypothetical protein